MLRANSSLSYLGQKPDVLFRRLPRLPDNINSTFFQGAFETEEYAISQSKFQEAVTRAVEEQLVRVFLDTYVHGTKRTKPGTPTGKFRVLTTRGEHDVDVVVNCLWEGRRAIDKQMGVPMWSGDNVRLKFGIKTDYIDQLASMPSATIVNGPFGDFVNYANDKRLYFSWYPISMLGMHHVDAVPHSLHKIADGKIEAALVAHQLASQERKFNELFPNLGFSFKCPSLVGFILGNGDKDVGDIDSPLHERADEPIFHDDGYFSISTQKFTTAPYNAQQLEERYLK